VGSSLVLTFQQPTTCNFCNTNSYFLAGVLLRNSILFPPSSPRVFYHSLLERPAEVKVEEGAGTGRAISQFKRVCYRITVLPGSDSLA